MPDMQACAGGVREHVQDVSLWLAGVEVLQVWGLESLLLCPKRLPLGLNLWERVSTRAGRNFMGCWGACCAIPLQA